MKRKFLHSKLHRAITTSADLDYEGSITLPPELMEAVDIKENEQVYVWNVANGNRFETYAIAAEPGSGEICVNGAAAHLASKGERLIIATFCDLEESEYAKHKPKVALISDINLNFALK